MIPASPEHSPRRVLVLSADVAGGHDAACRGVVESIRRAHPGAEIEVANGLEWCGPAVHWLVRDGYRIQITTLSERGYGWIFRFAATALGQQVYAVLVWALGGWRMLRRTRARRADLVISCYPLLTLLLGRERRRGRLKVPVAAVITDVAPSEICFAKGIDRHWVCTEGDVAEVHAERPRLHVEAIRPPIDLAFTPERCQREARERLGLPVDGQVVVVTGGSWAVGGMHELVGALVAGTTATVVVACGDNDRLRERLQREFPAGDAGAPSRVVPLPYCDDMPSLLAASDVIAHTAAGMTAFEAFAAERPVVISHPLGGHGARSAAALDREGLALLAGDDAAFVAGVQSALAGCAATTARVTRGRELGQLPDVGELAVALRPEAVPPLRRASLRVRRLTAHSVAAVGLLVAFNIARPDNDAAQAQAHRHVPMGERIELDGCDAHPRQPTTDAGRRARPTGPSASADAALRGTAPARCVTAA